MTPKNTFTSCLSLALLVATLVLSATLVSDTSTADTNANPDQMASESSAPPNASTMANNAITAANTAASRSSSSPDLTRSQLLKALLGYDSSLLVQKSAVQAPGDLLPNNDQPPPAYTKIPAIEADKEAALSKQTLFEDIFHLYGVSNIQPPELASVPLKTAYLSKHFSAYCTPLSRDETNAYVCNNAVTSPLQHADIKPLSLLGPLRYDDSASIAALEYIRSTVDPWAARNIKAAMNDINDSSNQDAIINALSRQSKLNAPIYAMLSAYARRLPSEKNPDNKTFMETLEFEASQRYPNINWHKNIAAAPPEALLKDIAAMMALSLWMQKEQYKQNERLELLLSVNVLSAISGEEQAKAAQTQGNQAASSAASTANAQQSSMEQSQ